MLIKRACQSSLIFSCALLFACEAKPPCDPGELPAAFQSDPLAKTVPTGEDVTVCASTGGATHATLWRPVSVHRANMDAVKRAQDNDWDRLDDNWYRSTDTSGRPKWSELASEQGKLRIDIAKAGDGAQIDLEFTPTN